MSVLPTDMFQMLTANSTGTTEYFVFRYSIRDTNIFTQDFVYTDTDAHTKHAHTYTASVTRSFSQNTHFKSREGYKTFCLSAMSTSSQYGHVTVVLLRIMHSL